MVPKLGEARLWAITITARQDLTDQDREFVVELTSEEARKVVSSLIFILHEAIEGKKYSKMIIEGTRDAIENLLLVLKTNLGYKIKSKYKIAVKVIA